MRFSRLSRNWSTATLPARLRPIVLVRLALVGCVLATACSSIGPFVWVNDYRDPRPSNQPAPYVLGPGDVISVKVFNQDGMSARGRVRIDGKVTLPFLNDVQAEGYQPEALAQQLRVRLEHLVHDPVVTVSVEEQRALPIVVVGEVAKPGITPVPPGSGVLHALVSAGGLTDFAHDDRIFVVRSTPEPVRIRFSYPALIRAARPASSFQLMTGDMIVVE